MKIVSSIFLGILIVLAMPAVPVRAHHGFAVEFDEKKPIMLAGVVTRMEFMNPHIYFYVDVKGKDGKVTNWAFEGGPPNVLYRQGWRKDTVKPGDAVTVKGFRAKDGANLASCTTVTFTDGRVLAAGPTLGTPGGYGLGTTSPKK